MRLLWCISLKFSRYKAHICVMRIVHSIDIDYSDNGKTWTIIHWPTEIILATNHIFRLLRSSAVTSANYYYPAYILFLFLLFFFDSATDEET